MFSQNIHGFFSRFSAFSCDPEQIHTRLTGHYKCSGDESECARPCDPLTVYSGCPPPLAHGAGKCLQLTMVLIRRQHPHKIPDNYNSGFLKQVEFIRMFIIKKSLRYFKFPNNEELQLISAFSPPSASWTTMMQSRKALWRPNTNKY